MAATDTFLNFLNSLSNEDREKLVDFVKGQREAIFAARSEEARVRIAHEFVHEVRNRLKK